MKILSSALVVAALGTLSGCADYPAVSTLSGTMQSSLSSWTPLASDFAETCKRRNRWYPAKPGGDPCEGYEATRAQLQDAIALLDNYFGAMAAVASDQNFTFDPGLDALGGSVQKLAKTEDQAKLTAISGLAKALANIAAAGVRKASLDKLIDQAGNVEVVVGAIGQVIKEDYGANLGNEASGFRIALSSATANAGLKTSPPCQGQSIVWTDPPLSAATAEQILFQRFYVDQCNAILARKAAADAVGPSAQAMIEGLEKLQASRGRLGTKDSIKALMSQAEDLFKKTRAVRDAFAATPAA